MLRHTELALVQKASLSDKINTLERQLAAEVTRSQQLTKDLEDTHNSWNEKIKGLEDTNKSWNEKIKGLEDTNKSWNEKIKDLDKQLKSLVTEIIGIMGVFATIIFAVFSGFNEISTLGGELSNTPISKVMIYIGTTFIVLIGIVFISYLAVGRFFDISLRSCGCKLDDECSHGLIEKHPLRCYFLAC